MKTIKVLLIILFLFLYTKIASAQQFMGGFENFSSSFANSIYASTVNFDGILNEDDDTVQEALDKIDDLTQSTIPCDKTTDDWCFEYDNNVLTLYVNQTAQWQWPETAVFDKLLLESGDFILLEDGTSKILLE